MKKWPVKYNEIILTMSHNASTKIVMQDSGATKSGVCRLRFLKNESLLKVSISSVNSFYNYASKFL